VTRDDEDRTGSDRPLFERPLDDLLPAAKPGSGRTVGFMRSARQADRREALADAQLAAIGWAQRRLVFVFLIDSSLAAALFTLLVWHSELGRRTEYPVLAGTVAVAVIGAAAWVAAAFDLARRLYGVNGAVLILASQLLPGPGKISFFALNKIATSTLREHGIRVGLFGARREDLVRLSPGIRT